MRFHLKVEDYPNIPVNQIVPALEPYKQYINMEGIRSSLEVIADPYADKVLREFYLNMLPYHVIQLLNSHNKKEEPANVNAMPKTYAPHFLSETKTQDDVISTVGTSRELVRGFLYKMGEPDQAREYVQWGTEKDISRGIAIVDSSYLDDTIIYMLGRSIGVFSKGDREKISEKVMSNSVDVDENGMLPINDWSINTVSQYLKEVLKIRVMVLRISSDRYKYAIHKGYEDNPNLVAVSSTTFGSYLEAWDSGLLRTIYKGTPA